MPKKWTWTVLSIAVVAACGGSDEGAPPSSSATISPTSSTSTSSIPEPGGQLEIHIDPAVESLSETQSVLEAILAAEEQYVVRPGTVALLYGSGEASVAWAETKAKEVNCFNDIGVDGFRNSVGWGRPCGLLMRVDAINFTCFEETLCKQGRTVAAHEFFHVVAYQLLEECTCEPKIYGNKIPNWLNEGIADYVGYATVYGTTPGTLDRSELERLRSELENRASNPSVAVGLVEMEELWASGFSNEWFQYLYDRSFLAVTLLIERFGDDVVLEDFFANVVDANTFASGFEETFGLTEAEFDAEFQEWITTLRPR